MILEVIATCMDDALRAEENGADRLELITAITEGGLTPGIGMIEQVAKSVKIPVHVMVRPHSRSFVYDKHDLETMTAEIKAITTTGAAGIVVGALTEEGKIDEKTLESMLTWAGGLNVTFHRAFDELEDQIAGLRILTRYSQISRVLTSGGLHPAPEAIPTIRRLVEESYGSSLQILAGNGLTPEVIKSFIEQTGVKEVHFGSAVRYGRSGLAPIDPIQLRALADSLH
ncbi:copper homeostasis protein CutC [Paenibacillus sp. WQ 127069]|jgi:copper homeostasis protein|uniref:PF03932 family protein CutC n=1 Tax=Paenibacillus baimaensis TaxID=2982185 RepID=A0ABT2UBL7_9BACL|nr:copper homeostasis protein CutC [Paenibacillus sp. WQ 127069]MCU6792015.1 copper homeostasis protein CutC [Paenibacillus sp. WQ 127069]